jgi:ribosome-associated protein
LTVLQITPSLQIPDSELAESFVRASGPGGQNVANSPSLPDALRARVLARRDRRLTADGVLVIQASRLRDQGRNREDARERLAEILRAALHVPKKRVATKPTRASKERRLDAKRVHSTHKKQRTVRNWSED